jgi:hypothetical protein
LVASAKGKLHNITFYNDFIRPFLADDENVLAISSAKTKPTSFVLFSVRKMGYFIFTSHRLIVIILKGLKLTFKSEIAYLKKGKIGDIISQVIVYDLGDEMEVRTSLSLSLETFAVMLNSAMTNKSEKWLIPKHSQNGKKIREIFERRQAYLHGETNAQTLPEEILCPGCGTGLELDEKEIKEKMFTCPECKETFHVTD